MRIHPQAVERGRAALAAGKPILCDVKMLQAGMTKVRGEILCAIDRPEVAALARTKGCTRAAAAMELLAPHLEGAIVAIGNAPTALWKVMEMARSGGPRPALVVGLPVGFVGARESKLALWESDLCSITNISPRGGSPGGGGGRQRLGHAGARRIMEKQWLTLRDSGPGHRLLAHAGPCHAHLRRHPADRLGRPVVPRRGAVRVLGAADHPPAAWRKTRAMTLVAMVGAAIFVISCMPIPVPWIGTCSASLRHGPGGRC